VSGFEFRVSGFRVSGFGFRVYFATERLLHEGTEEPATAQGLGFRV
jgi:hypothetical protein